MRIPMRGGHLRIKRSAKHTRQRAGQWVKVDRVCSDGLSSWSALCRVESIPRLMWKHRGRAAKCVAFRQGRGR